MVQNANWYGYTLEILSISAGPYRINMAQLEIWVPSQLSSDCLLIQGVLIVSEVATKRNPKKQLAVSHSLFKPSPFSAARGYVAELWTTRSPTYLRLRGRLC